MRKTKSINLHLIEKIEGFNWVLFVCMCAFLTLSVVLLYALGFENCSILEECTYKYGSWKPYALPQLYKIMLGLVVFFAASLINIKFWLKYAYYIFAAALILLLIVSFVGHTGMGAQRWISIGGLVFQPSEFIKVAIILAIAKYYAFVSTEQVYGIQTLFISGAIILLPTLLTLKQPDLGTAMIILGLGAGMLFVSGIPISRFKKAIAIFVLALPIIWEVGLKDYQKQRVLTFINPSRDTAGASYHINQSKIALGSGGFLGKGYIQGSQANLNFLPEKHTDFIFTTFAEQFGFLGSFLLILLYIITIATGYFIILGTRSRFGSLLGFGLLLNFFMYVFINLAMVMGAIPVVGVPLPLISFGGSSLISLLFSLGLLQNIYIHRSQVITTSED